jgi:hypothetical protein
MARVGRAARAHAGPRQSGSLLRAASKTPARRWTAAMCCPNPHAEASCPWISDFSRVGMLPACRARRAADGIRFVRGVRIRRLRAVLAATVIRGHQGQALRPSKCSPKPFAPRERGRTWGPAHGHASLRRSNSRRQRASRLGSNRTLRASSVCARPGRTRAPRAAARGADPQRAARAGRAGSGAGRGDAGPRARAGLLDADGTARRRLDRELGPAQRAGARQRLGCSGAAARVRCVDAQRSRRSTSARQDARGLWVLRALSRAVHRSRARVRRGASRAPRRARGGRAQHRHDARGGGLGHAAAPWLRHPIVERTASRAPLRTRRRLAGVCAAQRALGPDRR